MTLVSLAVMLSKNGQQAAELAKSRKDLMARLSVMKAEAAVCRPSSCYSWQCQNHDRLPRMFLRHCTDSPLPCTETGNPPGTNTAADQWIRSCVPGQHKTCTLASMPGNTDTL